MDKFNTGSGFGMISPEMGKFAKGFIIVILAVGIFIGLQVWWWVFCRIEIEPGKIGVLIAKIGKDLPSGDIIASDSRYKGIQLDVLSEGRHFYNPIFWDWELFSVVEVPPNHVGVTIRQYGNEFTDEETRNGKIIADDGQKGITRNILQPGMYRVNPYAEKIEITKAQEIPAGFVGVVTNLTGKKAAIGNTFLVEEGEKGVSKRVLTPGTHYLHPYLYHVDLMDCRSQRFEVTGDQALKFPSSDAFEMTVLMTVEWAIKEERAPEIFVRIGELNPDPEKNEILQKIIIPAIRGNGRIEGSKYSAIEYISGASRQIFQNTLSEKMKHACEPKGIVIKAVLINDIEAPQDIAKPIREREIAKEEFNRNKNQLLQAQAEQNLARSEELVKQEKEKVNAKTTNLVKIIDAQNNLKVALIEQDKLLSMEKTFLEASKREAQAILSRGKAQADVVALQNTAEGEAMKKGIDAFKNPDLFAYYEFALKIAPSLINITANTEGIFGKMLQNILPFNDDRKGVKP